MSENEFVQIADRVEAAKRHNTVSKREGLQAVKDREALLEELLQYKAYRDASRIRLDLPWAPVIP